MPWCPECGVEYREGFETCSDCGCKLSVNPVAAEADSISESEAGTESGIENGIESGPGCETENQFDKEAFLTSASNSIEADLLEGLLNAEEIPVLRKNDDVKIYMGGVTSGVELFVPSHLLDKAKEILEVSKGLLGSEIPEEELIAQALAAEPEDKEPEDMDEGFEEDDEAEVDSDKAEKAEEDSSGDENTEKDSAASDPEADDSAANDSAVDEKDFSKETVEEESANTLPDNEKSKSNAAESHGSGAGDNSFLKRFIHMLTGK